MASAIDKGKLLEELDAPFALSPEQRSFYAENGYIKLKHVLSATLLEHYRKIISERVAELSMDTVPFEQRSTYGKAFLQIMNLRIQSSDLLYATLIGCSLLWVDPAR